MTTANQETVYEGWLTKSPPTKRIWRARWRRRWFALKQSGELPGQYFLEYFTDRNCRKLKGTIDLDQCEQVDAGLRFERRKQKYQFMFDVKTPSRTYYLAADNEVDMNRWVDCICRVCGLKADEDIPIVPNYYNCGPNAFSNAPSIEHNEEEPDEKSPTESDVSGPYIPISECFSGKPLPFHISNEEMSYLPTYTNELSPMSPTSMPPSYTETMDSTLNTCNPRFYDSPRKARPCSNLNFTLYSNGSMSGEQHVASMTLPKNHGRSSGNISFNSKNGKIKTRPPDLVLELRNYSSRKDKASPTDSESVFTEDEWSHPIFPPEAGPRPSDSSIENELVAISANQRFSKVPLQSLKPVNTSSGISVSSSNLNVESITPPPRPPKPIQFQKESEHGYLNLDNINKSIENIYMNKSSVSPLIGPRTASTIVMDEFYDIPRSHQDPKAIINGRHCYTNAAPSQVQDGNKSLIFTYDFDNSRQDISKPEENSSAPAVDRGTKPRQNTSSPPSVNRKLKPTLPKANVKASTSSGFLTKPEQYSGATLRNHRAAPSPTPPKTDASDDENTIFTEEQIYFYSVGNKFIPAMPIDNENIQYLDLDLDTDGTSNTLPPKSPGSSTVYKQVDFVKTEAFKITKQSAEKSRTEKQNKELKKDT
ncbi:protein daughter of sevenless isoform X2 [Ctenocephalides felis]|uniref:protein daughter of sevenless isoform X2 n=1 Tax=Ctenocephalides felis TaxID=7515 RepID=UPI000E6E1583|nr:protein daughter of sevenless isoform X2 [Ctenocephalides felis]